LRDNLKELENEIHPTEELLLKSRQLKEELESMMVIFKEGSEYRRWKHRYFKTQRNKKWLKKRKEEKKEFKLEKQEEETVMHKVLDDWLGSVAEEKEKQKREKEQKQVEANKVQSRKVKKRKYRRKIAMLVKLEKLRVVRRSIWKSQGRIVRSEGAVSLEDLIKKVQEQVKEEQVSHSRSTIVEDDQPTPMDEEKEIDPIKKFYNQAENNLEKLISIRRNWDTYLVPRGMGSRIPQRVPSPPPPSSSAWESYLIAQI